MAYRKLLERPNFGPSKANY
uniref:Uncharacterized protein n=1 Tax=Rhizophora mucronata TaxID=61149 RepID=A0A2P2Q5S4_RHIMU